MLIYNATPSKSGQLGILYAGELTRSTMGNGHGFGVTGEFMDFPYPAAVERVDGWITVGGRMA